MELNDSRDKIRAAKRAGGRWRHAVLELASMRESLRRASRDQRERRSRAEFKTLLRDEQAFPVLHYAGYVSHWFERWRVRVASHEVREFLQQAQSECERIDGGCAQVRRRRIQAEHRSVVWIAECELQETRVECLLETPHAALLCRWTVSRVHLALEGCDFQSRTWHRIVLFVQCPWETH